MSTTKTDFSFNSSFITANPFFLHDWKKLGKFNGFNEAGVPDFESPEHKYYMVMLLEIEKSASQQ